jgi:glycosyltransferase involved in cell wall biosynthesis
MRLGFYYHIPIANINGSLYAPSYLSVFIVELANQLESLVLFMHEATELEMIHCDGIILNNNIKWVNLGIKTPAWHRVLFHKRLLNKKMGLLEKIDIFLVRSPSPLAPYFGKYTVGVKLVYMIVGDYSESLKNMNAGSLRERLVYLFLKHNNSLFVQCIKKTDILVNSSSLFNKYKLLAKSIHQIKTTTLSNNDFYLREDTCLNNKINLLYTGRIDIQKGLFELLEATKLLLQHGYDVDCNIVGWETNIKESVKKDLITFSVENGISTNIIFHGRKKVGEELNKLYRECDIYIIPSYHEGFPRTIWEAMANSLPVIATKVGSIPSFLIDKYHALLINPKDVRNLYFAIVQLIENGDLRKRLILHGSLLAKENTLEKQTQHLIKTLKYVAIN